MRDANQRNERGIGTVAVSGDSHPGHGILWRRDGSLIGRNARSDFTMANPIPARGLGRLSRPTSSIPETQAERPAAATVTPVAREGSGKAGFSHRPVDLVANCRSNRATVWRFLRPFGSLALASADELELPETRAPGQGRRPRADRTLADERLAAVKKNGLDGGAGQLSFQMKRVFDFSRPSDGPGGRKEILRSWTNGTATTDLPDCRSLPSRPVGIAWTCTLPFGPAMCGRMNSNNLRLNCWTIFPEGSCWFWTAGRSIKRRSDASNGGSAATGWPWNGCRPMPRNLTPPSRSGTTPSMADWPTSCPRTWRNWTTRLRMNCSECKANNRCSVRVSHMQV
jgi:hypothetical protein